MEESAHEDSATVDQVVSPFGEFIAGIEEVSANVAALAIETARIGAHDKGFAVLAEELRKLAEQSQEAAQRIAKLIGQSQNRPSRR